MDNNWVRIIQEEQSKDYYDALRNFLTEECDITTVLPDMSKVFSALEYTPLDKVKAVILGQDPYPTPGHAMGLSFSVSRGISIPRSLTNVYRELERDLGIPVSLHGDLTSWAKQGVLLLNTVLTVRAGEINSHRGKGWEQFTARIINEVANQTSPIVFILWGKQAQETAGYVKDIGQHLVIESSHPSPHSASISFFGSKPFSRTNQFLQTNKIAPIDWRV